MKLEVDLSPELDEFIDQEVASGRYASREEVLRHALEELKRDLEDYQESAKAILEGYQEIEAGGGMPLDEAFDELFRELDLDTDE